MNIFCSYLSYPDKIFKLLGKLSAPVKLKTNGSNSKLIKLSRHFNFSINVRTKFKELTNISIFCSYTYYLRTLVIKLQDKNKIIGKYKDYGGHLGKKCIFPKIGKKSAAPRWNLIHKIFINKFWQGAYLFHDAHKPNKILP